MNIFESFSLKGKTALVTGCKRGIGKGMTLALAEAGANIIGVSASLELEGSVVEKEVKALGREFKAYQCDFKDRSALYRLIEKVKSEHKQIDILINNAGNILRKPAAEHPDQYWDEIIEIDKSEFGYIGHHSHSHDYLIDKSEEEFINDIEIATKIFKEKLILKSL